MAKKQKKPIIQKDMLIGDVVSMFPEAAEIIQGYGLHCVGCYANAYETLEQGILGHGNPKKILNTMIRELNDAAKRIGSATIPKEAKSMKIMLTQRAQKQVQKIAVQERKEGKFLRIEVKAINGSFKYVLNFVDPESILPTEKQFSFSKGKVNIVADKRDFKKLHGLRVDYVEEKDRSGFKMNNPNQP